jgi:SAM-dependent methyltransferase
MEYSDLIKTLIKNNLILKDSVESWYSKLFLAPHDPGATPWDPVLCNLWNERPRENIEDLSDFYESDCCVVFQGTMSGSWNNINLNDKMSDYIKSGTSVLEYGSGGGSTAIGALKAGANVTICDVSTRLLNGVKLLALENGYEINTKLIKDDIPCIENQYDFVITIDCLEHVKKPIDVLSELIRCLRKDGHIWIEVFFGGHDLSPYHLVENSYLGDPKTWNDLLVNMGLQKVSGYDYLWKKT